ncbi:hypothetical protein AK830_g4893 [Neonectria ditissima]|uniref:Uncharacterized protein n=1 Tax=Neonectria ditissima TaxID=78410 RepID=A0A0P7BLZ8_9HYPO|nr:hypothetical protein AK830_g4893 [Neonectria ditissima]
MIKGTDFSRVELWGHVFRFPPLPKGKSHLSHAALASCARPTRSFVPTKRGPAPPHEPQPCRGIVAGAYLDNEGLSIAFLLQLRRLNLLRLDVASDDDDDDDDDGSFETALCDGATDDGDGGTHPPSPATLQRRQRLRSHPNEKPLRAAQALFYKQFTRPIAKTLLIAVFTYQLAYWAWTKAETDEIRAERDGPSPPPSLRWLLLWNPGLANVVRV